MNDQLTTDVVLIRLIEYLRLTGIDVHETLLFELVAIVQEGTQLTGKCNDDASTLFDWSLKRLNGRICDTRPQIAQPMPPLRRGHIGYDAEKHRGEIAGASQ